LELAFFELYRRHATRRVVAALGVVKHLDVVEYISPGILSGGVNKKTLRRINGLLKDCLRHPFEGIGKPEPLRENLSGYGSRRIDDTHRLVYAVDGAALVVIACRYHDQ
jgi:toxin YoeB